MLVFFDDILIYNRTWEKHLQHIETVLRSLEEQQFYAKLSKCEFGLMEMLYLGHIIGGGWTEGSVVTSNTPPFSFKCCLKY